MSKVLVVVLPKPVKVHLEASLVGKGTKDETFMFSLTIDGNNHSLPGLILLMRVREIESPGSRSWVEFGLNLNDHRRGHLGQVPLVGFVSATNHEENPVPLVPFELAVGLVLSAFGLPRSPHVENEPSMPNLALA